MTLDIKTGALNLDSFAELNVESFIHSSGFEAEGLGLQEVRHEVFLSVYAH